MVCPERADYTAAEAGPRPRTIAVMEFDNFSTGEHQEKLGYLTKGLADFFEADFAQIGTLKVVERDKIDFIKNEILLAKDGMVGADTAVRVGKLLGARIMVFGSIVQLDDEKAKMLVKAVDVETSEILAFCEREGKPDFFKMQEEMVVELAEKIEPKVQDQEAFKANGTRSTAAAELYSQGLYHMDHYEYAKAYAFFKQAYEADNTFAEAKRKMEVYRPLVLSS
jgi:TolB-like protein